MSTIQLPLTCDPGLEVCGREKEARLPVGLPGVVTPWLCDCDESLHLSEHCIALVVEYSREFHKLGALGLLHITGDPHKDGTAGPQNCNPNPSSFPKPCGSPDSLGEGTQVAETC